MARIRSAILLMLRTLVNSESAATGYERVRDAGAVGNEVAPSKGAQYDIRDLVHLEVSGFCGL